MPHKNNAIDELLSTEKNYKVALEKLIKIHNDNRNMHDEFYSTPHPETHRIFNSLIGFERISERLIKNIEKSIKHKDSPEKAEGYAKQRGLILDSFVSAYSAYISLYSTFLQEIEDKPEILEYFKLKLEAAQNDALRAITAQPFQRGPKYLFLLKESLRREGLTNERKEEIRILYGKLKNGIDAAAERMPMVTAKIEKDEYYVGKYVLTSASSVASAMANYRPGDISRALTSFSFWNKNEELQQTENYSPYEDENGFTLL
ncbi:RhoGEF domain-containing protein [Legionella rowbothamii]|uniref:RhoGEF domain-containing protein n=1 Tax=Legionella rowbothamii TaxID=96229 RepID=UPI001055A6BD|nr:RhoGEF domain-containing protein [Legionella rowbothamii]